MSKKRQTRKEKLVAQTRREQNSYSLPSILKLPEIKSESPTHTPSHHIQSQKAYAYVIADTKNTLIITLLILVANSIIYVLLQNIRIPF